jgi:hypothetical protein
MTSLVSSPARLVDSNSLSLFIKLFVAHGVLGWAVGPREFTEEDRMRVVPLVFGLIPRRAIYRDSRDSMIKPLIREHLASVGVDGASDMLVTVIKEVADQYVLTARPHAVRRKMTVADLRARYSREYRAIRSSQGHRCAVCGISLEDRDEHLDHRIPFRLVGDVSDGANWQLLCSVCNSGKWSWFSALQPSAAHNWVYGDLDNEVGGEGAGAVGESKATLRFCVLAQRRGCEVRGCGASVREGPLWVVMRHPLGLPVIDNLMVVCDSHRVRV